MHDLRRVITLFYRLFLSSWIFAVLWVKGYLWWLFAVAALLLLVDMLVAASNYSTSASGSQPAKSPSKRPASNSKEPDGGEEFSWREPKPPWSAQSTKKP
ncbi:MAG: hypothetical protein ACHRXM_08780 [Isosphaerales bacterium]